MILGENMTFRKRFLCVFCLLFSFLMLFSSCAKKEEKKNETLTKTETVTEETEKETKETETAETFSKTPLMQGIDVSKWQGDIDWGKLKSDGVEFAMVRLGYTGSSGNPAEDPNFAKNLKNADENGILTGGYFYSQAKNEEAARREAEFVLDKIATFAISFPVVIDYEWTGEVADLSAADRTKIALSFFEKVREGGYEPMLYVPIVELEDETLWEKEKIIENAMVWGAGYDAPVYPEKVHPDENTPYAMWQYSNTGKKNGIYGNVDLNLAYFTRERVEAKQ